MIVVNYYMKHECIAKLLTPFLEVRADMTMSWLNFSIKACYIN